MSRHGGEADLGDPVGKDARSQGQAAPGVDVDVDVPLQCSTNHTPSTLDAIVVPNGTSPNRLV